MSEPVKDYYKQVGNDQYQQNQYGAPPGNPQYNNYNGNNNMGYNPQMGQPVGQPVGQSGMAPPQMMEQNMMYTPNNYNQNPDQNNQYPGMGMPVGQNPYPGSSGSNQIQYQQPLYQPPGYAQGVPIEAQVIRVQQGGASQPQVPMLTHLDHCEYPTAFRCTFCQKESISTMTVEPGTGTWMACCCLFFCTFGVLSFIPFCTDQCQDKKHFCPFCGAQVGFREYKPCG